MHVAVLGAGVVGVTTAYYLSTLGHAVTLIERGTTVAAGASHANGGQLSYSHTDAFAHPDLLWKLPKLIAGKDPAILIRGGPQASLVRWGLSFLTQCTLALARENTLAALAITLKSEKLLTQMLQDLSLECAFRNAGKLVLLSTDKQMSDAQQSCKTKSQHGCHTSVLSMSEARAIEPALEHMPNEYTGAIYSERDTVADASMFCRQLSTWLTTHTDTTLKLNTNITRLVTHDSALQEIHTDNGSFKVDAAVVCLGAWSSRLLKPLGIRLPIYPVRGYSVSLPPGKNTADVSITDLKHRIVFSRLNDIVRIAGFADFLGFDASRDPARINQLLRIAKTVAPEIARFDVDQRMAWGGFRPMTPSGLPLTGDTGIKGLYLNTGHGTLGWTMACASSHDLAHQINNHYIYYAR